MARELAVTFYLFVFRMVFSVFKLFPQKQKTTFVASFGDNVFYTLKEVEKQTDQAIVVLKTSQCKINFSDSPNRIVLDFEVDFILDWILSIYHLATSEIIFIDNYYGFLATTHFKPNVKCIQLWHAAGAIKQFGLKDPSNQYRTKRAFARFQKVYQKFNHVVVGSEKMADIFKKCFGISCDAIHRSGIPRTDFFFNDTETTHATENLHQQFPSVKEKKVILYAPTYRDDQLNKTYIELDMMLMGKALKEDYILLLRLHPAITMDLDKVYSDFVINVSDYPYLNHLLVVTDILITDYSSIPFEFALLNKPIIFFAYDLEEYAKSRGFFEDYKAQMPGPIVKNTQALIKIIKENTFDLTLVNSFSKEWNTYSTGNSSEQLVQDLYFDQSEHLKRVEK